MSTPLLRPQAVVDINGADHYARTGSVRLDSTAVPYATSTLELPFMDDADLATLDPHAAVRVPFEAGDAASALRPFDLGLRSRVVDHSAKTVTLSLAGDEALLMDYTALTQDSGARAFQASARGVANYVLGKIGAALEAGTDDADVTAYWPLTNYVPNPTVATALGTFYIAGSGTTAVDYSTAVGGRVGTSAVRWTAAGAAPAFLSARQYTARAGEAYTASVYARSATTGRSMRIRFNWRDSENELIGFTVGPTVVVGTANWDSRLTITATAPPGTARIGLLVEGVGVPPTGQLFYADAFMLTDGTEVVDYFDGSTVPAGYTSAWSDGTHASQSTRTPVVERLPEMFVWPPGVSAWDFMLPILTAANLIMWCDELRNWFVSFPENRVIGDQINVSASTTRSGVDELSRDDPEAYVTGIVVRFSWTESGERREAFDSSGTPEKVLLVDLERPYPGPGIAAGMLARRQGTGRVQRVEAISRWTATPGMSAMISLPGAPDTVGRVTSVDWDLGSGFMDLGTSGLTDINPGDWLALDAATDWDDMPDATDWEDM